MMTEYASYGGRQVLPVKCMTVPPLFVHARFSTNDRITDDEHSFYIVVILLR